MGGLWNKTFDNQEQSHSIWIIEVPGTMGIIKPMKWFSHILVSSPKQWFPSCGWQCCQITHTVSPPCFQLLHHIKRQLKIHTFLILLFQVSNCCTLHKDVIWLWSKSNMNHDSKNGKVEYKTSSLLKE